MATTPGSRRRETRTDLTGDDRDPLNPMQEPLGSMDRPGPRTSDINDVNLPPGETVRRTGNLGTTASPRASTAERSGRSFTATFAIAAVVLLVAFLVALYLGNNRNEFATGTGSTQAPVANTDNGTTPGDTTGSTTTPPQQTAPGTGDANSTTGGTTGATTPPANP